MKTSKSIKFLSQFLLAVIGIFVTATLIGWLVPVAAAGIILGDTMVGTVVTDGGVTHEAVVDAEPGLHLADISKKVYELNPAATPVDTILRNIRDSETIKSVEKKFYSVSTKPFSDIFDSSVSGAGTSVSVPAKAYTYASGDGAATFYAKTSNPALFSVDDTFMMRDLTVPASGTVAVISGLTDAQKTTENIVFYIEDISSDILRIVPLNGIKGSGANAAKYVMPDFTATTPIYLMGNAKNEEALKTTPFAMIPEPETNYVQLFMAQVQISDWEQRQSKEVNWQFTDVERMNLYAMRWQMEMTHMYGAKSKTYNNVTKDVHYTADGITRRFTTELDYGTGSGNTTLSIDNWLTWQESAFVGNNGSPERFLIADSKLIKSIEAMILSDTTKQIGAREVQVVHGVRCTKLQNFFGTLNIVHSPLMSLTGATGQGYIIDFSHIHKHDFVPMTVKKLDLKSNGEKNADATVIMEASCLTASFPDVHAHIGPKI